jgi:glycosyltransferase involved in cell wall biosynthesis
VLALASYPNEAAATRYRVTQFAGPLRERGIDLTLSPFLSADQFRSLYRPGNLAGKALGLAASSLRRLGEVAARARAADVLFVQREAMTLGPPVVEWLASKALGRPMVLDLDDATYVGYVSPTYGRWGSALKWFRKTDDLIRWSRVVTCGNRFIAEYVRGKGVRAVVIPTVVDTDVFRPRAARDDAAAPVLGWIGTHSTYQYLETIFPALRQLARSHKFRLKIVGAGRESISLEGVEVENLSWSLAREVEDFRSFDVGLYPIVPDEWSAGKSGFKSVQYMAVGIPFVVTSFGAAAEIGEAGATHLTASTVDDWRDALARLVEDAGLRRRMGEAGRRHALDFYSVPAQADKLAAAMREAAAAGR